MSLIWLPVAKIRTHAKAYSMYDDIYTLYRYINISQKLISLYTVHNYINVYETEAVFNC